MARRNTGETLRLTVCALLLSVMLVLGWVENLLPPISGAVPGIKLGLSNSVLLFAVYMLDIPTAFVLMTLKVALSGFLFGNPMTILYAFAGGLMSLTAMALLARVKGLHPVIVSMAGGVMHNVGQVAMAMLVLRTPLMFYLGILIPVGLGCGALTGVAAAAVMRHLKSAGWQLKTEKRRGGMILLAAVLAAALGLWAVSAVLRPAVVVEPDAADHGPQLMTTDQLPLPPGE